MNNWIYHTNINNTSRFVLGTKGDNPIICVGVNPSTASPECLDNTIKSVERIAKFNGYDSWIMINLYPQRATNPDDIHKRINNMLHIENQDQIKKLLMTLDTVNIWMAWGNLVEHRPFLKRCLRDLINGFANYEFYSFRAGELTKKGHPRHPLYLPKDQKLTDFDIQNYSLE